VDEHERYFVTIGETLVGRKAGTAAARKAHDLRAADPIGTVRDRLLRRRSDKRAWRKGAFGERVVGWWLRDMADGWYVFNDVPVGLNGANIDHVAIGPPGVFTINAKNLSGKVAVRDGVFLQTGRRRDYLQRARDEAARASRLLAAAIGHPVAVRPDACGHRRRDHRRRTDRCSGERTTRSEALAASTTIHPVVVGCAPASGCRREANDVVALACSNFPACRQTRPLH
jgi:hypothetical protein